MNNVDNILKQMTLEEKIKLFSGQDFWHIEGVERLGIKSVMVTDGPHGLRKQLGSSDHVGLSSSVPATCFPTAVTLASTWNKDLLYRVGQALGEECVTEQVSVLLGPGVNIKRHPLCGRNFEYFSEDPLLSGSLASSFIQGVQSKGIGTSIKHYVANNQETMRMGVDTYVDERTLRELYLKSFEIAVKEAKPWTVMCSYNKVNGTYLSEHKHLLTDILKTEWGYNGLVVTDWGACNDRVAGLLAGQELEMPGSSHIHDSEILEAVKENIISLDLIDQRARKILELLLKANAVLSQEQTPYNQDNHHDFAGEVATEGIVLLRNENQLLPLQKKQSICLIGDFAIKPRYQGSGSSLIQPTKIISAYDAIKEECKTLFYAKGYDSNTDQIDEALVQEAIEQATQSDVVIVMVGLTSSYESEGFDRSHLDLPTNHLHLIDELVKVHKNIVVCLSNGAPVVLPFKDHVQAIVEQYLGGQNSGTALKNILFGYESPSGKLAETFPNHINEFPSNQNFPGRPRQVEYREGLYIGYHYYTSANIQPLYPFGYGLSYTTFEYSNLEVTIDDEIIITYDIKNTGTMDAKEVSQIYISKSDSMVYRPTLELKQYDKSLIVVGETNHIEVKIPISSLKIYHQNQFVLEDGTYHLYVGSSSVDLHLQQTIYLKGEILEQDPSPYHNIDSTLTPTKEDFEKQANFTIPLYPKTKPYTLNTVIGEVQGTLIGKLLKKVLLKQFKDMYDKDTQDEHALQQMVEHMVHEIPFRFLVLMSGGKISRRRALGLLDLMNKKIFRGFYRVIRG